jgi:hypothetical protein
MTDVFESQPISKRPILVSFADDRLQSARLRLKTEAIFSRFFGEVKMFTPRDLPAEILHFCERTSDSRGFGHYLWKPYFVNKVASAPEQVGKIIFWVDAGCWINRFGLPTYVKYLEAMTEERPFVAFERGDYKELQCVKRDVFYHLDAERFLHTAPLMAGVFGFRINEISRAVVARWYAECSEDVRLIDESVSRVGPEWPGFESHRNDQGVFSLLLKKADCYTAFPGEHILPEMNKSYLAMKDYPLIAMRDKGIES